MHFKMKVKPALHAGGWVTLTSSKQDPSVSKNIGHSSLLEDGEVLAGLEAIMAIKDSCMKCWTCIGEKYFAKYISLHNKPNF